MYCLITTLQNKRKWLKKAAVWKNKDADVTDGQEEKFLKLKVEKLLLPELHVMPNVSNMIQTKKHMQIIFVYLFIYFLNSVKGPNKDFKFKKFEFLSIISWVRRYRVKWEIQAQIQRSQSSHYPVFWHCITKGICLWLVSIMYTLKRHLLLHIGSI